MRLTFFLVLLLSALPRVASAFPELVRHGYGSCTSCHVSPNGGGILTPYGRGLSTEVLSTWGTETESKFAYGLVNFPEWLNFGGDVRAIQTYLNSTRVEAAKFIFMQADLEAAIGPEKFQAVGTIGYQNKDSFTFYGSQVFSRRHYLIYRPTEQLAIRAGKFLLAYGLNTDNHMISTRRGLGWDEGGETYNLELSYQKDPYEVFLSGSIGRPDARSLDREKGVAVRPAMIFKNTLKTGLGYYYGTNDQRSRHLVGPYAMLGITPRFFILAELDYQSSRPNGATESVSGIVDYLRVDYEFFQGVHAFVTQELTKLDFKNDRNATETYGIGVQFFPRPHFEFSAMFLKTRTRAVSDSFSDFAWFLMHYYL